MDISQDKLSKLAGITLHTITKIESGLHLIQELKQSEKSPTL
jgi:DNA-binding XRE family transcriptional regulator